MTWHVEIDRHACIGSGMCAGLLPDVFVLEGTTARPVHPDVDESELMLDAADCCPASAITVTSGGEEIGPRH